jgi:hypothetical protein
MNAHFLLGSVLWSTALLAQEVLRDVVPGRIFHDSKVLTPGQTDLWAVDGKLDEVLKCAVTASDLDPVLDLVDEGGAVLASNDGAGSRSYVQFRLQKAGKVQFRVRGFQGAGGGRYELSLERYVAAPAEPGSEVRGEFGKEHWHHVRLQLGKWQRFVPVVEGGRVTAIVHFAANQPLGDELGAFTAPAAGEYHVRIEGDERQAFTLRLLQPVYQTAAAGASVGGKVEPFGLHIVQLRLPGGAASLLDLGQWGPPLQVRHRLLGEDPRWRELGSAQKGGRSRRLFLPERDLDLELWLRNVDGVASPYEFGHQVVDAAVADDGPTDGQLPLCGIACHTLQAREGEVLTVRIGATAFDAGLVVVAPNGEQLACVADRGPLDRDPEMTFCVPFRGTWRLVAFAESHTGSGHYRVDVVRHEVPVLVVGKPLELPAENGRDAHARLALAAGQEVWLSVKSRDVDVALSIDDDHGPRLCTWEGGGVDGNVLGAFRAPQAGTYTLFVHSRRGAGRCVLSAHAAE